MFHTVHFEFGHYIFLLLSCAQLSCCGHHILSLSRSSSASLPLGLDSLGSLKSLEHLLSRNLHTDDDKWTFINFHSPTLPQLLIPSENFLSTLQHLPGKVDKSMGLCYQVYMSGLKSLLPSFLHLLYPTP